MRMSRVVFPAILVGFCLLLPALGGLVGYRLAGRRTAGNVSWNTPDALMQQLEAMREAETMAGAFAFDGLPLAGVEKCYHTDPGDFAKIIWTGRDIPTPFVGFAQQPRSLPECLINDQQFRYRRNLDRPKPERTCRIFVVGGSTAFGSGATSNETTVAGYLERYLNEPNDYGCRFEVVTAATTCWASAHERILIENRLVELEPDVVIALSGHNDVFWGMLQRNINSYRAIQDDLFFRLVQASYKDEFPDDQGVWQGGVSGAVTAARLRRNVLLAQTALQSVNADFCFALQPILSCSRKERSPREERMATRPGAFPIVADQVEFAGRYGDCRTALASLKLPHYHFWDLTPLFDTAGRADIFIDRCHFGDRGHDLIAQKMRELLAPILRARLKPAGR